MQLIPRPLIGPQMRERRPTIVPDHQNPQCPEFRPVACRLHHGTALPRHRPRRRGPVAPVASLASGSPLA